MRAHVYRNLNEGGRRSGEPRARVWSVRARVDGREKVIAHEQRVELEHVKFRVQLGARATVQRTRSRSVHAYAAGELRERAPATRSGGGWQRFTYDPYGAPTFVLAETGAPVLGAELVRFDEDGAWLKNPTHVNRERTRPS